jgi:hypothetical protein
MLPPPPPPNAGRAVIGFPIGGIALLVITAVVRFFVHGMDSYLINVKLVDKLFAGWFWEDEATLMIFLLGGAIGFMWGAGMFYDFSSAPAPKSKVARIPVDPDAPPDLDRNLIAPLFEAIPSVLVVIVVLGVVLAGVGLLPLALSTVDQTTNDSASPSDYGDNNFGLLGLVNFDGTNQAVLFAGFAAVVVGAIVTMGLGIALLFYLLNREVKTAEVIKAPAGDGPDILPIRMVAFLTDWALDMLDAVSSAVKTR